MSSSEKQQELFQYVLIIKKEKPVNIDYVSILLCFISLIFFLYYSFLHGSYTHLLFWLTLLIPVTVARTIWIKKKINNRIEYKHPLFITGIVWLFVPGLRWIAVLFIIFILFDHQARQPLEIGVSDERIVINTFFRKRYQWKEFSNVVLKDNLLTLDFKNNRILQKETDPYTSKVDETEFNLFCKEQLNTSFSEGG